jgi:hypothetical protein
MIAAVKRYRCIITMPDKMSEEKKNLMKALGAEVIVTPTNVPADSPQSYYSVAKRIASETPGAWYPDQYNAHPLLPETAHTGSGHRRSQHHQGFERAQRFRGRGAHAFERRTVSQVEI